MVSRFLKGIINEDLQLKCMLIYSFIKDKPEGKLKALMIYQAALGHKKSVTAVISSGIVGYN